VVQDDETLDTFGIFIVDDDESVGFGVATLLKANGYAASAFASAEAFLADGPVERWVCGIVDVQLPGIDGLALVERLHGLAGERPRLLMMTGQVAPDIRRRAAAAGVLEILFKPLDPLEVVAAVRRALCE
jgi:FixJ family two-component response regulator